MGKFTSDENQICAVFLKNNNATKTYEYSGMRPYFMYSFHYCTKAFDRFFFTNYTGQHTIWQISMLSPCYLISPHTQTQNTTDCLSWLFLH